MNGTQLISEVRSRLRDQAAPYLWSDETILTYLNEAQRIMCERTHVLVEYDTYVLETVIGQTRYELDSEILSVIAAKVDSEITPMRSYSRGASIIYTTTTGVPTRYAMLPGNNPVQLTLYPSPDAVYTIRLAAAVRPSRDIVAGSEPEVPPEHHMALVAGAIAECLIHQDTDGFAPDLLERYEDRWGIYLRDIKREVYRRILGPNAVAHIPSWTGG